MRNTFGALKEIESILKEGKQHIWNCEGRDINHRIMPAERAK